MSILEIIDNAVQDWETSADAMRWTPEPARSSQVVDFAERLGYELTEWRRDTVARLFDVPARLVDLPPGWRAPTSGTYRVRFHFDWTPVGAPASLRRLAPVSDRMRTCYPIRPAPISLMRSAYRHKTRNRW